MLDTELGAAAAARDLTIGSPSAWELVAPLDAAALQAELWSEGYYVSPTPAVPPALIARCRDAIELVRAAEVHPLAAFAFDAPWELCALIHDHAAAAFDGEAAVLPAFWAWRLTDAHPRGWEPHRDRARNPIDERGAPRSMTLWVAITDARTDNGCIHVVPAPYDLQYGNPRASNDLMHPSAIRALPAPAGSILGWTSGLLHWGGLARAGRSGRTSIAFEYQAAAHPPPDEPIYPRGWFPAPAERRALIARQWEQYEHMHELPASGRVRLDAVLDVLLP